MDQCDGIQFITTRRGKTAVQFRGYRYYNVRALGHKIYWRCCTRTCSATLVTANGVLTKVGDDHNHLMDLTLSSPCQEDLAAVQRVLNEETVKSLFNIKKEIDPGVELEDKFNSNCHSVSRPEEERDSLQPSCVNRFVGRRLSIEQSMQISKDGASRFRRDVATRLSLVEKTGNNSRRFSTSDMDKQSVTSPNTTCNSGSENHTLSVRRSPIQGVADVVGMGEGGLVGQAAAPDQTRATLFTGRNAAFPDFLKKAQQIHHGNSQVASRPGMQSRPPQGLQSRPPQGMQSRPPQGMQPRARMPAPSATVTSAAPPLKRPRLETQRAVPQTNRQMGQAPVQRQNMSTFDQSHRMPAPRSVVRSPQRPIGVQQMSTQQARPMQHRQVSRSPQRQIARSKQQISQSRNSEPKSDSTERAFLNPDHSSHIMTELSALWKSGKFVDAAIMVGGMKLQAHRMVLFAASPYLRASFDHLNPATELRLKMPSDIKLDIVYQFLTYIYDGILRLNPNNAFSLLKISLMLRMEHLTMCCQEYMTYAVNSGTIPPMAVKDVKSPLLVLVDQKAQETGQGKADMCTQTMSDSEPSTIRSPPKVDFDRVFGEDDHATSSYHSNQFDHSVQSDMDLYQNYDQGLGDGGGGGRVVHTQDDGDAMPMIIVKNECIDPEYELSINPPHLTSPPPDLDNMSPASNQSEPRSDTEQHMSSQTDPLPDTDISSPAAQAGVEAMQVVPGIDLDVSSPDTPDHDLEQSTNGSVHQSPLTSTFDQSQVGTSAFDQSQVSTSAFDQSTSSTSTDQLHSLEQSSVSQSETNGTPSYTFTSESNIAEGYESFPDRTSDNSHTNTEDQTSAFTQSAPDQSLPLVESGDHATPQFGTEEFLSSDFDVQMSNAPKSEPDDPV
ncbi:uncharacterized protein LOC124116851 isoform X2 [Haliotis rufescens]|uniref:uncharacterized protein LOC124116851 isoform X2 n=1 Tax=Haliotis rufescens TaxID=6454 RepID=UPI00201F9D6C|nr:uncharacterized protein LOC124116851 isoform X2 [Haliotis rufescens]